MKIELRNFVDSDAESLALNANNKKVAAFLRNNFPSPYTVEDAKKFIKSCIEKNDPFRIDKAIIVDGKAVGTISIDFNDQNDVYKKTAEIGYWLGEKYWGNGIMPKILTYVTYDIFMTYDIERIYAETFEINNNSRKCLKKANFTHEGTLRNNLYKYDVLQNSCIYSILREEVRPINLN